MTPDPAATEADIASAVPPRPSTAGMTTKVVKGSLWTLGGQVAPLGVSLVTTPFVIRMLGAESYGVLILVGLIPTYLGFADFGMSMASTKFASEAYAEGDATREARIVRTAGLISLCTSLPFGIAIFALSGWLAAVFNVPAHLHAEASLALKFAAVTFVLNFLNGIFNTPQLTRLRMDLNTFVTSGFRILGLIATPFAVYLDGVVGAVFVLMLASLLTLAGHILISGRLVRHLFETTLERPAIRPMLKFGGALVIGGIAGVLLVNLEKAVLARTSNVETLAYYSVAFNFAMMATMFSSAMLQSLIPAFSQLMTPEKRGQLNDLFLRALRMNIIGMLPVLVGLLVIARPLFTIWAGEDFGRESTGPFYILLAGLFFNLVAYIPYSLLMASGRTDIFAKLYWIELVPYLGLIALLTLKFGAAGAAAAWSIRVIVDAVVITLLARRFVGISFSQLTDKAAILVIALFLLLAPLIPLGLLGEQSKWPFFLFAVCATVYSIGVWKKLIEKGEKAWLISKFHAAFGEQDR